MDNDLSFLDIDDNYELSEEYIAAASKKEEEIIDAMFHMRVLVAMTGLSEKAVAEALENKGGNPIVTAAQEKLASYEAGLNKLASDEEKAEYIAVTPLQKYVNK